MTSIDRSLDLLATIHSIGYADQAVTIVTPPSPPPPSVFSLGAAYRGDTPGLVAWFQSIAHAGDFIIALPADVPAISGVSVANRIVLYSSAAAAAAGVPALALAKQIDVVAYDIECRLQTPLSERQNPIGSMQAMNALALANGLIDRATGRPGSACGPDRNYAKGGAVCHQTDGVASIPPACGAQMSVFCSQMTLQIQGFGAILSDIHTFTDPIIQAIRSTNPLCRIMVQMNTAISVADQLTIVASFHGSLRIDGASVLYDSGTFSNLRQFEAQVR